MSELSLEDKLCKNLENSCNKSYEAGRQSMQAKIDDIQSKLINMEFFYNRKKNECAGLQGRIDSALQMLRDWGDQTYRDDAEQLIGELGDALRGDSE